LVYLVLKLSGIERDKHDRVDTRRGHVLDPACQRAEIAGRVDDVDTPLPLLRFGFERIDHLRGGDGRKIGRHDGDLLPGGRGRLD
jgi:hypothetical protein